METKDMLLYGALLAGGGLLLYYFLKPKPVTAAYLQPTTGPALQPAIQPSTPAVTYKDEHFSASLPLDKIWSWTLGLFNKDESVTKDGVNKTVTSPEQTSFVNPIGTNPSMFS